MQAPKPALSQRRKLFFIITKKKQLGKKAAKDRDKINNLPALSFNDLLQPLMYLFLESKRWH